MAISVALAAPSPASPPVDARSSAGRSLESGSAAPSVLPPFRLAEPLARRPLVPPPAASLTDPLVAAFGVDRYRTPKREHVANPYREGPYGPAHWTLVPPLAIDPPELPPEAEATLRGDGEMIEVRQALAQVVKPPVKPAWMCRPRKATVVRYGAEQDTFLLADCDGAVQAEGLERLSVLARPVTMERPAWPLPDEPTASNKAEWVDGLRILPPRLAMAVQKLVETWPWRPIYLISGYRPGGHSYHAHGRALDLFVMGVPNERVYKICREFADMGCGYYPNNRFVHMDVRAPGTGKAYWIDTSAPGEPSHYVDAWPGVEAGGAAVWQSGGE